MRPIVKENTSLERDRHTKAILNRDQGAYMRARKRKEVKAQQNKIIVDLIKRVEILEKKLSDLDK